MKAFSVDFQLVNLFAMSKLKVFKYQQILLTVLGICPRPPNLSFLLSCLHSISQYFIVFWLIVCIILSATYVYHGSMRSSDIFEAMALVFGGWEGTVAYLNMRWKMDTVDDVHSALQAIVDQGNFFGFEFVDKI